MNEMQKISQLMSHKANKVKVLPDENDDECFSNVAIMLNQSVRRAQGMLECSAGRRRGCPNARPGLCIGAYSLCLYEF